MEQTKSEMKAYTDSANVAVRATLSDQMKETMSSLTEIRMETDSVTKALK